MKRLILPAAVLLIAGVSLLPFLWFVTTSWKSAIEISAIPPVLWPSFHWEHYQSAPRQHGPLRYIANSAIVAGATTVVNIVIASLAAYALARFKLRWANYYLLLLLALSMFPQIAIAGPVWRLLSGLGWLIVITASLRPTSHFRCRLPLGC